MTLEQALLWADTFGKMQGCTPDDPPDGNSPALLTLAAEVRRLDKGLCESNVRSLECEAGAPAMREALEMCKRLPIARGYPDGPCLDRADHEEVCAALATNAGRDLLAEVERSKEALRISEHERKAHESELRRLAGRCNQESELASLRLKVKAAEGMAEAFENHRCGCQNQELRAALAAWKAGSK